MVAQLGKGPPIKGNFNFVGIITVLTGNNLWE